MADSTLEDISREIEEALQSRISALVKMDKQDDTARSMHLRAKRSAYQHSLELVTAILNSYDKEHLISEHY